MKTDFRYLLYLLLMNVSDITKQTGWVVVTTKSVYEYSTFEEAMGAQQLLGGALMTKEFYVHHYSKPI
jgi:hypothetical protein